MTRDIIVLLVQLGGIFYASWTFFKIFKAMRKRDDSADNTPNREDLK